VLLPLEVHIVLREWRKYTPTNRTTQLASLLTGSMPISVADR
jgi:hypothetical protein